MSDIFISYARSSEPIAKAAGDALRQAGFNVWRDDELPAHRSYSEVIEERLQSAKAVLVLWSGEAVRSQWVRAEADIAREAGTLVQMSVDGTTPPIPFNQIQCADLADWTGNPRHPGWMKILDSVGSLVGPAVPEPAPAAKRTPSDRKRIIVIPFENMSGDNEQDYFSDGISEDIITDLSNVSALDVVARNQAFSFKGKEIDIEMIGEQMGVSHVVEGSVRKAEGRVRITSQLIDTANCNQVWAERYDRELKDIFSLQDEISKAIVAALRLKLLPKEKKAIENRGTTHSDAYNLYLMARQHWISGSGYDQRSVEIASRICRQAIAIDADYAKAWGLMALALARLSVTYDHRDGGDAKEAAEKALQLDPDNVEALCAKAMLLGGVAKHDEAAPLLERALAIDPESYEVNKEAARGAFQQRDFERAAGHYEKAVELLDTDFHGAAMLMACYRVMGDQANMERAANITIERCKKLFEKDPAHGPAFGMGVAALGAIGDHGRAREWLERALLVDPDNIYMRYNLACTLAGDLADQEKALEVLEPFFAKIGYEMLHHAEVDPDMDGLRDHPRFQEMLNAAKDRTKAAREA